MSVRAKFRCQYINNKKYAGGGGSSEVILNPITPHNSEDGEINKRFWESTPSGELKMTITNKQAADYFVPGKDYYLDFTEVPELTA